MDDAETVAKLMAAVKGDQCVPPCITVRGGTWAELTLAIREYELLIDRLEKYIGSPVEAHRARLAALREALEVGT